MTLGWTPIDETIELTNGDWIFERTNRAGGIPPDTVIEIVWANGVTWPGDIEGATVRWRKEAAECSATVIPHGTAFEILVRYPNEATGTTDDYVWMGGWSIRTNYLETQDF
ncbi:hypothetical protein GS909_07920 [Rhodococcus hoagii]|nr:hypothetical protein [Prescottella equi]NKV11058.1 hypothetical protein [Prescottella equi]